MSERPSPSLPGPVPAYRPADRAVIALVGLLTVVVGALESMTIPVLPLVQGDLGLDPARAALIPSTLTVAGALATPFVGSLADRYGGRRVLLAVAVLVAGGAALSALAGTFPLLVGGQALQGVGVGVVPLGLVLLRERFPARGRSVAVGFVAGMFTLGGGLGVVLAGPIAEGLSWRWMFGLPAAVIAVLGAVAYGVLPRQERTVDDRRGALDWAGGALLAGALFSLMLALTELPGRGWTSPFVLGFLGAALVVGVLWALVELRVAEPLVDVRMLARPVVLGGTLLAVVLGTGYAVAYLAIPQLVVAPAETGYGLGGTATDVGRYLLPGAAAAAVAGPLAGLAGRRFGARPVVVAGLLVAVAGALTGAWLHSAAWQLVLVFVLLGAGVGAGLTALYNGILDTVRPAETGAATGINTVARSVGIALGLQLSAAVVARSADGSATGLPTESGYTVSFLVAAAVTLLAVPLAWVIPRVGAGGTDEGGDAAPAPPAVTAPTRRSHP
ncbi:MFS transporter [Streptomyces sp. NPDC048290]|uniref:MFS transporter n=1 Tax=Streptomyces sp. NPDC048290 TaxID=3155811 RepID=UPI00341F9164